MPDNFITNAGSGGTTFASDDLGGSPAVHYPRVKVSQGNDGVAQDGWTPARLISAASTNAGVIKAAAGQIGLIIAINTNAAVRYLKLYNLTTSPTVGTDTPIVTIPIPGNTAGAGVAISIPGGLNFSTGIARALTTGAADSDTGAVAANEIILTFGYV